MIPPEDTTLLSTRGTTTCRGCGSRALESVLDLGEQPLSNELLHLPDASESFYPLHLRICTLCGLGQVGEVVPPETIFAEYPYLSSVSSSWLEHSRRYAHQAIEELRLGGESLVIEVASNDGYLLKQIAELGVPVLGVEPARNVAEIASRDGVSTVNAFFGRDTAAALLESHGHPDLIVANNVMAHVPDLDDFVGGFALLCASETVVTVENPSFTRLLTETQFDTIYHEHYSYLSAHAVAATVALHDLELFRVEHLSTHGGSYRYWIAPRGSRPVEPSVQAAVEAELSAGLLGSELRNAFEQRSRATIQGLRDWFTERASAGATVVGYGAAAKGNTLLNAARVKPTQMIAVVDANRQKQGMYLPGSRIPVVGPEGLAALSATDVLLLPWNLRAEIMPIIARLVPGATTWVAVPTMTTLP